MDRVYKTDIPAIRKALIELKAEFAEIESVTDWYHLRIEPLLKHAGSLERLLRSPRFAKEVSRLRRGVVMFHSDLVYFRQNLQSLRMILEHERKLQSKKVLPRATNRRKKTGTK
jgi:hypothetical protein